MNQHRIMWPCKSNEFTAEQQARVDEFAADIRTARDNAADGYPFHLWVDGRLHDSAVTHHDAFLNGKAIRFGGCQDSIRIGQGIGYAVTGGVEFTV